MIHTIEITWAALRLLGATEVPLRLEVDGIAGRLFGMDLDGTYIYRVE